MSGQSAINLLPALGALSYLGRQKRKSTPARTIFAGIDEQAGNFRSNSLLDPDMKPREAVPLVSQKSGATGGTWKFRSGLSETNGGKHALTAVKRLKNKHRAGRHGNRNGHR